MTTNPIPRRAYRQPAGISPPVSPAPLQCASDPDPAAPPTSFEELWARALTLESRPALGSIPDGWAGWVACAVQVCDDIGTVVMDFPADRILDTIASTLNVAGWRIVHRRSTQFGGPEKPLRYILDLERKLRV